MYDGLHLVFDLRVNDSRAVVQCHARVPASRLSRAGDRHPVSARCHSSPALMKRPSTSLNSRWIPRVRAQGEVPSEVAAQAPGQAPAGASPRGRGPRRAASSATRYAPQVALANGVSPNRGRAVASSRHETPQAARWTCWTFPNASPAPDSSRRLSTVRSRVVAVHHHAEGQPLGHRPQRRQRRATRRPRTARPARRRCRPPNRPAPGATPPRRPPPAPAARPRTQPPSTPSGPPARASLVSASDVQIPHRQRVLLDELRGAARPARPSGW